MLKTELSILKLNFIVRSDLCRDVGTPYRVVSIKDEEPSAQ
jgi:hypothetical protein